MVRKVNGERVGWRQLTDVDLAQFWSWDRPMVVIETLWELLGGSDELDGLTSLRGPLTLTNTPKHPKLCVGGFMSERTWILLC